MFFSCFLWALSKMGIFTVPCQYGCGCLLNYISKWLVEHPCFQGIHLFLFHNTGPPYHTQITACGRNMKVKIPFSTSCTTQACFTGGSGPVPIEINTRVIIRRQAMSTPQEESDTLIIQQVESVDATNSLVVADDTDICVLLLDVCYHGDVITQATTNIFVCYGQNANR